MLTALSSTWSCVCVEVMGQNSSIFRNSDALSKRARNFSESIFHAQVAQFS